MVKRRNFVGALCVVGALFLPAPEAGAESVGSRLKYRSSGSVCSCESGMSEAEISRAMVKMGLDVRSSAASKIPKEAERLEDAPRSEAQQHHRREIDEKGK
ncbi:MAG: hypothetical protein KUL88_07005 [Rhizobium sp.]|nr:hypothetical protein [Rhizobium sp.]